MKLFEKEFEFRKDRPPILVIDLRVSLWRILYGVAKFEELWSFEDLKLFWQHKVHYPVEAFPKQKFQIVFVDDIKFKSGNYWRENFLKAHDIDFPKYKGNRKLNERPQLFFDLHQAAVEFAAEEGFPYFSKRGYEADDFAGAIYNIVKKHNGIGREVVFYTVDSDWGQLVNDELGILFYYCAFPCWKHKLRNEAAIIQWFDEKQDVKLSEVREIVDCKVEYGDKSDNLIPGSPREVIDLANPGRTLPKSTLKELEKVLLSDGKTNNPVKAMKTKLYLDRKLYDYVSSQDDREVSEG